MSLSPDERQVALALRSGSPENLDIWTIDVARNMRNLVTSDAEAEGWDHDKLIEWAKPRARIYEIPEAEPKPTEPEQPAPPRKQPTESGC